MYNFLYGFSFPRSNRLYFALNIIKVPLRSSFDLFELVPRGLLVIVMSFLVTIIEPVSFCRTYSFWRAAIFHHQ